MKKTFVIAVCGPSGSGKSTVVSGMAARLGCPVFSADRYFKSELPKMISPDDGREYDDWNSPASVDYDAFVSDVRREIEEDRPRYLIVEGVLIMTSEKVRDLADATVYVDASPETCIFRRILRNTSEFGMTVAEVGEYYLRCARHREREYCLPAKETADYVIDNDVSFTRDLEEVLSEILR
ncbi:MAG: AAA family ATPase [Clostridia bacterium]|nr:AAA family ATPase [Clostridia bacterium]